MLLRLLQGRAKDADAKERFQRMFYQIEANAPHPGRLGGWIGFDNPLRFLVVERWGSIAALDSWRTSPA